MFRVGHTIISDDVATAKFHCDLSKCHGACCVVGEAGAPVGRDEIPVLKKAYRLLESELPEESRKEVEKDGLVVDQGYGPELNCRNSGECVFVEYDENKVAYCAIQKAYFEGRINWEKPISCHLFPIRIKKIAGLEYINYQYVRAICKPGCQKGQKDGIFLSEFLKTALVRRYGDDWYETFRKRCKEVRSKARPEVKLIC